MVLKEVGSRRCDSLSRRCKAKSCFLLANSVGSSSNASSSAFVVAVDFLVELGGFEDFANLSAKSVQLCLETRWEPIRQLCLKNRGAN